jgi:predicted ATP-dependent protease
MVDRPHVQQAIEENEYRCSRVPKNYQDSVLRGVTILDTDGKKIGQINGLTVIQLGNHEFGHPSRITATARPGENKIIDIERESELGGDIHTKGILILSHYLANRYVRHRSLSVSASVVFEQSYGEIDGDSASMAELCALLSAIADIPLHQHLAITGSMDQRGNSQAIGGVNEKIEGYFDICQHRGLNGQHGVIIPSANIPHLMLKQSVTSAVKSGQFHIYAIDHVDEAMELFTDLETGVANKKGEFPENSLNLLLENALIEMTDVLHADEEEHEEKTDKHNKHDVNKKSEE